MWRKSLISLFLAILAILITNSVVLADTPTSDSSTSLPMQGQFAMVPGNPTSQLRLKTSSTDNSGWLLEVSLSPVGLKSNNGVNPVWNVRGPFSLGMAQRPLATGTATGWVGSNGTGDIVLAAEGNPTSLDMSFTQVKQ